MTYKELRAHQYALLERVDDGGPGLFYCDNCRGMAGTILVEVWRDDNGQITEADWRCDACKNT